MKEIIISMLKEKLQGAVERNKAPCLLFSGGLDTAILSYLNPGSLAVNVSLESFGEDLHYSEILSGYLNLKLCRREVKVEEALEAIPEVIRILKTFDPAIPNDLTVYFGLKTAKQKGFNEVMTGDGADELFAGYSYMQDMEDLEDYINKVSKKMIFNSNRLGEFFDIKIRQPYLDKELVDFSSDVPVDLKIRKEGEAVWGKWILRKAFEGELPSESIWQSKRPLEYGSGMTELKRYISAMVSDEEFREAQKNGDGIVPILLSKEHLYYYKIYRDVVGEIPCPENGEEKCPNCGAVIKKEGNHCRICGWVRLI